MNWMKIRSIKTKIIIAFSIIFLLVNVFLLLLNQVFLDDFFISNNFKNMENHVSEKINWINQLDESAYDLEQVADDLQMKTGSDVNIIKQDLSFGRLPNRIEENLNYLIQNYKYLFTEAQNTTEAVTAVIGDGDYINRKTLYIRTLPSGDMIVITKALGLIMEAQEVFINFLILSSLIVYCFSIVLVYIFAERFTKPIRQVEKSALQISNMNFEKKLDENRYDEIGSLNKHINNMALNLSEAISKLNDSNQNLMIELNKERNMEAMREQFISDVSHELKNPISIIIGYAEGINRGFVKTEEDNAFYNKVILEEGKRMNDLVEELLDLSSYRSGSIILEKDTIQLSSIITKAMDKYTLIQEAKNISVSLVLDDSVNIIGDELRFGQVINNLLDNAFKYTNENGEIKVVLEKDMLTFSNSGKLILASEFENIWNSFYQIDPDHSGSGIGLAIVKSIVQLHGFEIRGFLENSMNHFQITFR
ncbi:MAG: HAMP domain-containing histidine kinase [Tissierellales bacterium]|nr:HAMP domain-containing histidine kinase [Tissierellales bacterium]